MLPYHYIEAVLNFTNLALRQVSTHHEGDDDEPMSAIEVALMSVLLASFDLLLALLWRPRFSETHHDLHTKIFTHMLSHMSTMHDLFEPGWQLMLASFSSHDRYDRGLVHGLLRPYLNPFRHYSTFSLLAISDLRCLLQLMPKMFSPTLADKLFEHLVRLHGLLGGALSQGAQPDSRVEEIVPLIHGVIGLFPLISGGQRLKPQIDQVAASLSFYQQQNKSGGPDKKRKDSKTKLKMLERKKSLLASQGARTYPTAAKAPRGASNVMDPRPKFDRVRSGGQDEATAGRPGILRLGSHEVKEKPPTVVRLDSGDDKPELTRVKSPEELIRMKSSDKKGSLSSGRKGSGDSDKVLSGSESDEPGCRKCREKSSHDTGNCKTKGSNNYFTDKLFTATPKPLSKFSGLSISPLDFGLNEGTSSEIPMFLRVRSRSFGPAERRRISRDRKEAMGLEDDAEDEDDDEEEDTQQELKQKLIQQELHRQLQQQLQSQQFEQLQRQQMQFLQQMQAQQVQALANMQRQQNQFLQAQFEQKHSVDATPSSGGLTTPGLGYLPVSQPSSPGGNTNTYLPSDKPSPPSRPQSPPGIPPSLSCSSQSSWPQPPSSVSCSAASTSTTFFAPLTSFGMSSSSTSSSSASSGPPFSSCSSGLCSSSSHVPPPAMIRRPPPPPTAAVPPLHRDGSGGLTNGNGNVVCHVCTKSTPATSAACFYCGTHLTVHVTGSGGWKNSLESQFSAAFPHFPAHSSSEASAQRALNRQQGQDRGTKP